MFGLTRTRILFAASITAGCLLAGQAWADLTDYSQDFEGLDVNSATALGDDGWKVGANVYAPDGTTFIYNYFTFPAGNGTGGFSNVTSTTTDPPGMPPVGNQGLVAFNDYNNADHGNGSGNRIQAFLFQEQTIAPADVGKTVDFSFVAAPGDLGGASTALAFLKTIDPNAGFADSSFTSFDTTSLPAGNTAETLSLEITPGLVGHILQFGFINTASNFDPSGVNYDNINFVVPEPASLAIAGLGGMVMLRRRRK